MGRGVQLVLLFDINATASVFVISGINEYSIMRTAVNAGCLQLETQS